MNINYSETIGAVSSIITYSPKFYFKLNGSLYSVADKYNIRKHNSSDRYNSFFTGDIPKESIIHICSNKDTHITKVFDTIQIPVADRYPTTPAAIFNTELITSNPTNLFDIREGTASASIPRAFGSELFGDRLVGKYLISKLTYKNSSGTKINIPFVATTYRYSHS